MKNKIKHLVIALVVLATLNLLPATARAQGTAFTYNGRLNANGSPANGSYDLLFTLYNAVTNGTMFGTLTNTATAITNGLFTVPLDFGGVFNGSNYWLDISVSQAGSNTFSELSPRQLIMPTPYAIYSATAGSAATAGTAGIAGSANSVSAANIIGTVQVTQLPVGVVMNNQNGVALTGTFSGNGSGLTSLPANAALLNSNQTFTGVNIFTNYFVIGTPPPFSRSVQVRPAANRILGILAANGGGGSVSSGMTIESVNDANSANQPLEFRGSPNVFTTGNVGIGKTTAATALDVNGAVTLSGNFYLPATTTNAGIIYSGGSTLMHAFGTNNFFAGTGAGNLTMSGSGNSAIGPAGPLAHNTTGNQNTASGQGALGFNTTGSGNTADGWFALLYNTTGSGNTASGFQALWGNTTGNNNTANGYDALVSNTTGIQNTANGGQALQSNTSGNWNSANGQLALQNNTTGQNNTATGQSALRNNTTGQGNTATGVWALNYNNGSNNTSDGYDSLQQNTTGSYNIAQGYYALFANTTGSYNIALGSQAGYNLTTGSSNIDIGNMGLATDTNIIRIGSGQTQAFIAGVITGNGGGLTSVPMAGLTGTLADNQLSTNIARLFIPNTATQATAGVVITSGFITGTTITNGGAGYAVASLVTVTDVTGSNAVITATVSNGVVTSLAIQNAGVNYSTNATLTIAPPPNNSIQTFGSGVVFSGANTFINPNNTFAGSFTGNGAGLTNVNLTGLSAMSASENAANGYQALNANTTGIANTGDGYAALQNNTTGNENTADGFSALQRNTTGSDNTAVGSGALPYNTSGGNNTAVGRWSLLFNSTGGANTAEGAYSLEQNTTGNNNTANGEWALENNRTGSQNTASGQAALSDNTTGGYNTANGYDALLNNTIGNYNTANGVDTLYANISGIENTADGGYALYSNTNGSYNTGNGEDALHYNTSGSNNTANGFQSLFHNTTGSYNTANGINALYSNTTGINNIAEGYQAGYNIITGNNNIEIGNVGTTNDNNTIYIGTQGVQTNTSIAGIFGATTASGVPVYVTSSGQLGTLTSSARFKQDIQSMNNASEVLLSLHPVTFHYKSEIDPQAIPQFGLVAEEVEKVAPDLVAHDDKGKIYTVRYEAVNAMLLNEFLKQHHQVEEQNTEIETLKQSVTELKQLVQTLADRK